MSTVHFLSPAESVSTSAPSGVSPVWRQSFTEKSHWWVDLFLGSVRQMFRAQVVLLLPGVQGAVWSHDEARGATLWQDLHHPRSSEVSSSSWLTAALLQRNTFKPERLESDQMLMWEQKSRVFTWRDWKSLQGLGLIQSCSRSIPTAPFDYRPHFRPD